MTGISLPRDHPAHSLVYALHALGKLDPLSDEDRRKIEGVKPVRGGSTADVAAFLGISRDAVEGAAKEAPADLPGAPVPYGEGKIRRRLWWDLDRVRDWWEAYGAWKRRRETQHPVAKATPPRPRTRRRAAKGSPRPSLLTQVNGGRKGG